jgi:3-methyl-2-oxobutanoate hydroxymethyltransferase
MPNTEFQNTTGKAKKITILDLQKKHQDKKPITMVTGKALTSVVFLSIPAYDYTSATLVDKAGIDMILVGDSLGMVMLGSNSTTAVTMEDMIHHSKAVIKGSKQSFIVGDMPFGSYEVNPMLAVQNAIRLVKEGGVEAVKMEGGKRIKDAVRAVVNAGIPVIGHIGLTPQTISALGGFKVQGKTAEVGLLFVCTNSGRLLKLY